MELNQKQNLKLMLDGQMPEYVPIAEFWGPNDAEAGDPLWTMAPPSILGNYRGPEGGYDPWGVRFVTNEETGYAALPEPNNFIIKDITKWDQYIKKPDWSNWDWEKAAKEDKGRMKYNPEQTLFLSKGFDDYFQQYIGMMGFTEGLCALYEEREAVEDLLDFMVDVAVDVTKNVLHYYKPEAYYLLDDSASKYAPFMSRETFEEIFVPRYKKTLDLVRDAGLPVFYHNCGRCEDFIPSMQKLGVMVWDPAQPENDLKEIKNRYGRQIIINGGYEYRMPVEWPNVKEDDVRQTVQDAFDLLAPNGGWIFMGSVTTLDNNDPTVIKVNGWIKDEAKKLSKTVYK